MLLTHILGFFFISIIGSLLHFTYEWSNHNKFVALFSAVNESTWEHIKIGLTPSFILIIIEYFIHSNNPNFIFAKVIALLSIILLIPIFFYTFKFIFKKHIFTVDIAIFFLAILIGQISSYIIMNNNPISEYLTYTSTILLIIIFIIYLILTFFPPKNFIFEDPITKKYGLEGHGETHHE